MESRFQATHCETQPRNFNVFPTSFFYFSYESFSRTYKRCNKEVRLNLFILIAFKLRQYRNISVIFKMRLILMDSYLLFSISTNNPVLGGHSVCVMISTKYINRNEMELTKQTNELQSNIFKSHRNSLMYVLSNIFLVYWFNCFIRNWLLTEEHRFNGAWLCITKLFKKRKV
jgi:hypothetical protein